MVIVYKQLVWKEKYITSGCATKKKNLNHLQVYFPITTLPVVLYFLLITLQNKSTGLKAFPYLLCLGCICSLGIFAPHSHMCHNQASSIMAEALGVQLQKETAYTGNQYSIFTNGSRLSTKTQLESLVFVRPCANAYNQLFPSSFLRFLS